MAFVASVTWLHCGIFRLFGVVLHIIFSTLRYIFSFQKSILKKSKKQRFFQDFKHPMCIHLVYLPSIGRSSPTWNNTIWCRPKRWTLCVPWQFWALWLDTPKDVQGGPLVDTSSETEFPTYDCGKTLKIQWVGSWVPSWNCVMVCSWWCVFLDTSWHPTYCIFP